MSIFDPNTIALKLVPYKANYQVFQVAENGNLLQLVHKNGSPFIVRSVNNLRDKLGMLYSKGQITEHQYNILIGF